MEPTHVQPEPSASGRPSHLRLGEILIRRGHIDQDDLALALSQQDLDDHDLPVGRLLVALGAISDETLTNALSEQSGLPVVDLDALTPDADLLGRLSREVALQLDVLPLEQREGAVVVAVAEPPTRELRREIGRRLGARAQVVLATPAALHRAIDRAFPAESNRALAPSASEPLDLIPSTGVRYEVGTSDEVARIGGRAAGRPALEPVPEAPDRILEWLVTSAVESGARSVHVLTQPECVLVRARVGRDMRDLVELPEPAGSMLVSRLFRSFGLTAEKGAPQRGTSSNGRRGFGPALALEAAPTAHGLSVLVRPLEPEPAFDQEPPSLDVIRGHLARVVVDQGRGLAVLLCRERELRRTLLRRLAIDPLMRARNVATVDVVCEVALPRMSQLSSGMHRGQADAIRSARALDHDVVLVDVEPGDDEALRAVVNAGMEDAAVIAGVEADAPRAITELCASVPSPFLASALDLVLCVDATGLTSAVTLTDEIREHLLDGDGGQALIATIDAATAGVDLG
ncbi:MAG TPA: hypothetical protein VFZ17_05460 [Acidimicrobiia bacterium]|nr:hypothetical protein [Acidimicrobiia bacterium]